MLHRAARQPMGHMGAATMGAPKCGQAGLTSDIGRRPMVPIVSFLPDLTTLLQLGCLRKLSLSLSGPCSCMAIEAWC